MAPCNNVSALRTSSSLMFCSCNPAVVSLKTSRKKTTAKVRGSLGRAVKNGGGWIRKQSIKNLIKRIKEEIPGKRAAAGLWTDYGGLLPGVQEAGARLDHDFIRSRGRKTASAEDMAGVRRTSLRKFFDDHISCQLDILGERQRERESLISP